MFNYNLVVGKYKNLMSTWKNRVLRKTLLKKNEAILCQKLFDQRLQRVYTGIKEYVYNQSEKSMLNYKARQLAERIIKTKYMKMMKVYQKYRQGKNAVKYEV